MFEREARSLGFTHAAVGPMVRSSYHADQQAHGRACVAAAGEARRRPEDGVASRRPAARRRLRSRSSPRSARRPRTATAARADRPPGAGAGRAAPSGKLLKAKELRGRVVVNVIWATWSPAARMELPEVQRVYRELPRKGPGDRRARDRREPGRGARVLAQARLFVPGGDAQRRLLRSLRPRQHDADVLHRRPAGNAAGTGSPARSAPRSSRHCCDRCSPRRRRPRASRRSDGRVSAPPSRRKSGSSLVGAKPRQCSRRPASALAHPSSASFASISASSSAKSGSPT